MCGIISGHVVIIDLFTGQAWPWVILDELGIEFILFA